MPPAACSSHSHPVVPDAALISLGQIALPLLKLLEEVPFERAALAAMHESETKRDAARDG